MTISPYLDLKKRRYGGRKEQSRRSATSTRNASPADIFSKKGGVQRIIVPQQPAERQRRLTLSPGGGMFPYHRGQYPIAIRVPILKPDCQRGLMNLTVSGGTSS